MTPDEFSILALGLGPGVHAKTIFETVQYRLGDKAIASLGWPEHGWAVVKIDPARQAWALGLSDGVATEPGRRRKSGIMLLRLAAVDQAVAAELLAAAWSFMQRRGGRGRARAVVAEAPARLSA